MGRFLLPLTQTVNEWLMNIADADVADVADGVASTPYVICLSRKKDSCKNER